MINRVYSSTAPTPAILKATYSLRAGHRTSSVADRHLRYHLGSNASFGVDADARCLENKIVCCRGSEGGRRPCQEEGAGGGGEGREKWGE